MSHPRFRSKRDPRQSIRFTNSRFDIIDGDKLRLPKIGDVDLRWSRELPAGPTSVTVVKDASGRYFASFVVEAAEVALPGAPAEVGIYLALTTFAVMSDGTKIASPTFLPRAERRLRRAQQSMSRKEKRPNHDRPVVVTLAHQQDVYDRYRSLGDSLAKLSRSSGGTGRQPASSGSGRCCR
ncbi:MAG: RNA-guided endonuclease InsQ/TnpB family protein [Acidimicrobiales bacterium]